MRSHGALEEVAEPTPTGIHVLEVAAEEPQGELPVQVPANHSAPLTAEADPCESEW